jgi:hypothetical protein
VNRCFQSADQDIKLGGLNDRFVGGANERQILAAQPEIYAPALTGLQAGSSRSASPQAFCSKFGQYGHTINFVKHFSRSTPKQSLPKNHFRDGRPF